MKFKCLQSGCVYTFESELDIKSMLQSRDYVVVEEVHDKSAAKVPVALATVVPVKPVQPGPDKPLPTAPVATKAI